MKAPFPEEFNRQSVSLIAAANFAPTTKAAKALYAQGIPKSKVFVVGNTGIDAARIASDNLKPPKYVIDALNSWDKTLLFMTMHRRENQPRMNKYYDTVARVVGKRTDVKVLVPLHPNPVAKKAASNACEKYNTFVCVKPLDYEATQWVLNRCSIVITDSGGLQEEPTWYSKPVLVLRRSTERTEAIDVGVSLLAYDFDTLESNLFELLVPGSGLMEQMSQRTFPFGDGYAAEKIAKIMRTIDWHATDMKQVKPKTGTHIKSTQTTELKKPAQIYNTAGVSLLKTVMKSMQSDTFQQMENFSDRWVTRNGPVLAGYSNKWVLDSFHWWSRVWEYPFIFEQLRSYVKPHMKVLDVGAGVSFFHWYLKKTILSNSELIASDYDPTYKSIYEKLQQIEKVEVIQRTEDMRDNSVYTSESFDAVYSISVLEHTDDFENIVDTIHRLLKVGGRFLVTFDVTFGSSKRQVPVARAKQLVQYIETKFVSEFPVSINIDNCMTPRYVFNDPSKKKWVPSEWKINQPENMNLCVFSGVFTKKATPLAGESAQTTELKKPGHKLTNTKRKCAMSPLRPTDRTGSVVHDMMFAWAYAEANGLDYKGPFGQRSDLQELNFAVAKFELPWSLQNTKNTDCKILDPKTYRNEAILKSTWPSIRNSFKHRTLMNTCAVHIRRGDVSATFPMTGDYYRYRDDAYFLRLIKKHCGTLEVVIFSDSGLNVKFWETTGYTLKLSTTIAETWSGMLHSQVFITSASSFSYTPALFAQGTIVYTPFWHKPMADWTISSPSPSLPWKNVENSFTIVEKQCEGGVHGSIRPTVSTCVLSPSSTILFQHMPHAAETLFNCWSLFQHHATEHCNFFFADGLKTTPYANWMIKRMGCFVIEKLPSRCAYVSTYSAELHVGPGDTFSWFHTPKAAQRLRENAFLYLTSRSLQDSSVGIIRRKSTRKMLLPEAQVEKMTQVFFEDMNFDEQATFFYEHETILAAHGAAIIWAPFARPCSAIVQVYPQNYYPIGFYETLIQESGSVPITWWQGLTIGDEKNVKWLNAFKLHYENRENLRHQNIEISVNDWKKVRSAASDGRKKCSVLKKESPVTLTSQPPCEEESQTVRECSSSDSKYQACSVKGTIDVILTVWKRGSLKSQLNDIARQTKPVSHVWVVQNENHVEGVEHIVKDFKGTHPGIPTDIVNFGLNSKFHGRFYIAYFMSSAEYVSVWDDDIVVGNKWLEYSISESKKHGNALVGANGRIIHSISPLKQIRNKVGENDFVGHTWTMRRELLRYFLATPQYTYLTGEDMQISFALQKHGIISWLPTHDNDGRYVTNTKWSGNNVASYIKPETNKQRSWLACTLIYNGFKTIDCNDCDKGTAVKCINAQL
jgi:2-polyprenyl-3-methyl-5-hydroxy-6-metoxy-1,4-benzoquinol methylase